MFSKKLGFVFGFARMGLALLVLLVPSFSQLVDCIVAEVNNQIITLTDIKILRAFGISAGRRGGTYPESLRQVLDGAIEQKIVISLVRENVTISQEEVDRRLSETFERWTPEEKQKTLTEFGLKENDLRPYLEENILYQKILGLRFSQSAHISLKEIEAYYNQDYVPSERAQGREPKPMAQVLDELEALVRKQKVADQMDSWINSLRDQADVRISESCFEQAQ